MIDTPVGAGPQSLEGQGLLSASLGAYTLEVYQTPLLDLTKTYANIELVPARPGFIPCLLRSVNLNRWLLESASGTQTTPPTIRAGSDIGHSNFIPVDVTSPSNARVNAGIVPVQISGPPAAAIGVKQFPGLPIYFDVTIPAAGTGGYSAMAKYTCVVGWIAVGG